MLDGGLLNAGWCELERDSVYTDPKSGTATADVCACEPQLLLALGYQVDPVTTDDRPIKAPHQQVRFQIIGNARI